ncbi:hypothetical protein HS141_10295 [Cetobacterium somerae]|nr:hypothetical protein [Cetobacterium somerae]
MYGRRMTISEINAHLELTLSASQISRITDRVFEGIDLEGEKDILSIVIGENESSKF